MSADPGPGPEAASGAGSDADEALCRSEVVRHHRVIQGWLNGTAPRTGDGFAALADAHHPEFSLLGPDGTVLDRDAVLDALASAHGADPGLRIAIADVRLVGAHGPLLVASYTEHGAGGTRVSTVLLLRTAAQRLLWRHLHETWAAADGVGTRGG